MPDNMTADVDRDGKGSDMRRISFDVNAETGTNAFKALRADVKLIYFVHYIAFKFSVQRINVRNGYIAQQSFFRQQRRVFKVAADTDAENYGRAGVRSGD